jgi:hypothetical protein
VRDLRLSNSSGRDTTIRYVSTRPPPPPPQGRNKNPAHFRRYLSATVEGLHESLTEVHGEDYAQALIEGDPEVDLERVGRTIGDTHVVFLSAEGEVMYAPPEVVELIFSPEGEERERRTPEDVEGNVGSESPVRWTGRRMKRADVVRRFVFRRALQLFHVDGLTYDYLYAMAKELDEADEMVMMGGGGKGKDPLIFQTNGTPYRAFLEGRVDGERFQLLLHLSNMELKRPAAKKA